MNNPIAESQRMNIHKASQSGQTPVYVPVLMVLVAVMIFGAVTYLDLRDRRTADSRAERLLLINFEKVATSSSFMDPQLEDVATNGQQRIDDAKKLMREYEVRSNKRNVVRWTSVVALFLPALVLFYKRRRG